MKRHSLYLAPLRGITSHIFRTVYATHFDGIDLAVSPFVPTVKGRVVRRTHIRDLLPENNTVMPLIPQVIGNDPDTFIILAKCLAELGYTEINWNLGCPFPQVTKKKRGSGLLPFPDIIESFLDRVMPSLEIKLSIKVRLGLDSPTELHTLIPLFNAYPLSELIIHPRTGAQLYRGCVDLEAFSECLCLCKHSVVYNGDIRRDDDFLKYSRRFPSVQSWMIGRGVIADPFLPYRIKNRDINVPDKTRRLGRFHDDLFDHYSEAVDNRRHVLGIMKELWSLLAYSFPDTPNLLKNIRRIKTCDKYTEYMDDFFASCDT
ncbi:MAG: tRNA-dihydrouridine synthase family protein [Chitinivibrionales bacterium]|nr:tRNA-dihydrouridine synthase family protein [Chitinivibrionales bacterium]